LEDAKAVITASEAQNSKTPPKIGKDWLWLNNWETCGDRHRFLGWLQHRNKSLLLG
jgi:hypothetical protein